MKPLLACVLLLTPILQAQFTERIPTRRTYSTATSTPADIPANTPDPGFPLRVHIFTTRYGGSAGNYHGFGTGNVLDGSFASGFDYTYECAVPFRFNPALTDGYQARWQKQPFTLELLMEVVGANIEDTCSLKLAPKPRPLAPSEVILPSYNTGTVFSGPLYQQPDLLLADPDPDYPLRFHVISASRFYDRNGTQGAGTANLVESDIRGADFTYHCSPGFLASTVVTEAYQARWRKPDQELELLLARPGTDKADRCKVKVTIQSAPFPDYPRTVQSAQHFRPPSSIEAPTVNSEPDESPVYHPQAPQP